MIENNNIRAATVKALTAEVKVLTVGSRQVTLSVYRQLDFVPTDRIAPFGRVRADRHQPESTIELVGSSDDILVRSFMDRTSWRADSPDSFQHWLNHAKGVRRVTPADPWVKICQRNGYWLRLKARFDEDGNRYGYLKTSCSTYDCCIKHFGAMTEEDKRLRDEHESGDHCHENGVDGLRAIAEADWNAMADVFEQDQKIYDGFAAMPLIVLAGLK